jgi:phosphoribosylaminoimidazole-succinocarboxamide synthase
MPYIKDLETREEFDETIVDLCNELDPDLVVLAGWMHLFTSTYTDVWGSRTINLHPALPNMFPGAHAFEDAWKAYEQGMIVKSGLMVHKVIEEVDAGEVIDTQEIMIYPTDTYETFCERMKAAEKPLLIRSIKKYLSSIPYYCGKVRNMYDNYDGTLTIRMTDRLSSFDRHICDIPNKGAILNKTAVWWFNQTEHIIPNHLLSHDETSMTVKKCSVIPIEVVVRYFMTGSTKTSLWTHYNNGVREYCGITFRDGYTKNERLDTIVITPTTKSESDEPISGDEIVSRDILTHEQWNYISEKALELFIYGANLAGSKGLILVDTKYEFGFDEDGNIILIDEMHTCDSSRYWLSDTYYAKFENGEEPDRFDKDVIRVWVRERCDPYNEPIPSIPEELIEKVSNVYNNFYQTLIN